MLKHQPETLEINDCRRGMNQRKGFKKSFKTSHVVAMLNMIRICFSLLLTAVTKEGYEYLVRFFEKKEIQLLLNFRKYRTSFIISILMLQKSLIFDVVFEFYHCTKFLAKTEN